jgi:DNA repair photolyase
MSRPWGETVEVKVNFVQTLKKQLEKKPKGTFGLGTVTDPYQGVEKEFELSRGSLMELRRMGSPVSVLTKSDLVLRDADILAGWGGAEVGVSIGTVDDEMASLLEPGAPPPSRRFKAIRELSNNGIQAYVMAAPIIAGVGDSEDSLKRLVRMTADSDVKRIMWDKFNSKPIAGSRLRAALGRQSIELGRADDSWVRLVRGTLQRECGESGIELLEAF